MEVDLAIRNQFERHLKRFFMGHADEVRSIGRGPIETRLEGFHVDVIQPGPRQPGCWTYVTCGAASVLAAPPSHRMEFLLVGLRQDERWLEVATMVAYYQAGPEGQRFGLGHTVPLGEPLVPGGTCDTLLFCLPYAYGPDLEKCPLDDGTHIQVLWALPITASEKAFKNENGLEALESRFEQAELEFWDMSRAAVV